MTNTSNTTNNDNLIEQPDDELHDAVDELQSYIRVLAERGIDPQLAVELAGKMVLAKRLEDLDLTISGFRDDVMLFLNTGGLPMKVPSTEELLSRYNPEVLELIKHGDAEMEVFEDRIVLLRRQTSA